MLNLKATEYRIAVEAGFKIWASAIGGGSAKDRPTLVVLHGGPGSGHDYLQNLASLASETQRVVFYDQLGCGKSDRPDDPKRWNLDRFVNELATVREALNLNEVVLLGQSWGGMLALEYLLSRQPAGIAGLILSNTLCSAPIFAAELMRLKNALPGTILATLNQNEANGTTESAAYKKAVEAFYCQHILRVTPLPKPVLDALNAENQVYQVMWGSNEFNLTGNLKTWDRSKDLSQINVPTLIISGEFDESTPASNLALERGIPHSKWILMPGCSHLPNLENPEAYLQHIGDFLNALHQDLLQTP